MRRFLPVLCLLTVMIFVMPGTAFAKDIYVTVDGTGNGTAGSPYGNIQTAINAAVYGDTVRMGPGTFRSGTNFTGSISVTRSGISLKGEGPDKTILAGGGNASVVSIINVANMSVSGFKITGGGGRKNWINGGGIYCKSISRSVLITGNTITGNDALYGGGIYCDQAEPTISGNIITGNSSEGYGGGINAYAASGLESNPYIVNNLITNNTAGYGGGGITAQLNAYPTITNNTITGNTGGIMSASSSYPWITNCIVWNNGVNGKPNFYGSYGGSNNISSDPLFVDAVGGNYQLQVSSSAVNTGKSAGAPATDILGVVRPQGKGIDIGAYERLASPLTVPVAAGAVSVQYPAAIASGMTSATKIPLGSVLPPTDRLLVGDAHYEITSTADRVAPLGVIVTLSYDDTGLSDAEKASIRLYHYVGGTWVDITTGEPNLGAKTVSGSTTSFSPFGAFYTEDDPAPAPVSTPASSAWSIGVLMALGLAYLMNRRMSQA